MKHLALSALAFTFAFTSVGYSAQAKSKYTLSEVLSSKLGDPSYKYKVAACLFFDAELLMRSGASKKYKSLFVSEEEFLLVRDEFIKRYELVNAKAFDDLVTHDATHLMVDKHFRGKLARSKEGVKEIQKSCKTIMLSIVNKDNLPTPLETEATQTSDASAHEECLEARDYQGCMQHKSGTKPVTESTSSTDQCFPSGWCIAGNNKPDAFGFPKPMGWIYKYSPELNNIQYLDVTVSPNKTSYEVNWYKVKVRGQYGRYISTRQIFRRIRPGAPGTSGYTSSTGGNRTDCKGYDNGLGTITMDCTTEAPTVIDIPGTAGRSAQNVSETLHSIIDCRDFTFVRRWVSASPRANNKEGKWKKVTSQYFGDPDAIKKDVCSIVDTLPPSSYRGYE